MDDKYKAMLFGIAIFIGGMITIIILKKFLTDEAEQPVQYRQVSLRPIEIPTEIEIPAETNETVALLNDIKNELQSGKPSGQVFNLDFEVTDQIKDIKSRAKCKLPWSKVDIINMGPSPVYFCINEWYWSEAPIEPGLSINVDFNKRDSIKRLYLKCDKDLTSNVRLQIVK